MAAYEKSKGGTHFEIKSFRTLKSMKEEGSPSSTNPSCNVLHIQTQIIALISNPKANKSSSMHATLYLMEHQMAMMEALENMEATTNYSKQLIPLRETHREKEKKDQCMQIATYIPNRPK
ncbi:hypothetical protein AAG906_006832 [Vitis piasezkii]